MVKLHVIAEGYYSLNMQVQHYQTFIETNAKSYIYLSINLNVHNFFLDLIRIHLINITDIMNREFFQQSF